MELMTLNEIADLYVDAVVVDDRNQLLFLSAWGYDTVLQEFLARLSVPSQENGLDRFTLQGDNCTRYVEIGEHHRLRKHTGRNTQNESIFNNIAHLMLYDVRAKSIDRANRQCLLFKKQVESEGEFFWRLWQGVREVCHVPLLEEWHFLVTQFRQNNWIQFFPGIGIDAYRINLSSDEVEQYISQLVKNGELSLLTLSKKPQALNNTADKANQILM
jgi:hypothetical protein